MELFPLIFWNFHLGVEQGEGDFNQNCNAVYLPLKLDLNKSQIFFYIEIGSSFIIAYTTPPKVVSVCFVGQIKHTTCPKDKT